MNEYDQLRNIAFDQSYRERMAEQSRPVMTEDQKKRHIAKLDETRPLKGRFRDYVTEVDVSSDCELPPEYQNHLDRKYVKKSDGPLDVAAFRAYCEELDKDQEWIEKTEKELF